MALACWHGWHPGGDLAGPVPEQEGPRRGRGALPLNGFETATTRRDTRVQVSVCDIIKYMHTHV